MEFDIKSDIELNRNTVLNLGSTIRFFSYLYFNINYKDMF